MHTAHISLLIGASLFVSNIQAKTFLKALQVEYTTSPIAITTNHPRFTWQMDADDDRKGWRQTAYKIIVTDENGDVVWNSGKVKSDKSLNIPYNGSTLKPTTCYTWHLEVWNQKNQLMSASSSFETALQLSTDLNHSVTTPSFYSPQAWDGAKWIGRGNDAISFYAYYLPVFTITYNLQLDRSSGSTCASLLFGANDPRLMDANKNLLGACNENDSSYIRIELDIAPLKRMQPAYLNVYRKGYKNKESSTKPIASFSIPEDIANSSNCYEPHLIKIDCNAGKAAFYIDNSPKALGKVTLNPTGKSGGDYIAYPVVGDMGYMLPAGQKATFSNVNIKCYRAPHNTITSLQDSPITINGGSTGFMHTYKLKANAAPMLRSVFKTNDKKIRRARLYVTAHGIYDCYINGKRVGNAYFNPGSTQYDKTQTYQTFDVTGVLQSGTQNAIGAILSEGWWSGGSTYITDNWNFFGDRQALLAKLKIVYEDGTQQTVVSSPDTWQTYDNGPLQFGSFFQGEVYDARKEQNTYGWTTVAYNDAGWQKAVEIKEEQFKAAPDFQLIADMAAPVMPVDTLAALNMEEVRPGVYVYDLGQNMAGVPLIKFGSLKPGTKVKLRFAETRYPDLPKYKDNQGMIMTENLRVAMCQDIYVAKGSGEETFSPRFTSHGFRYIEITGIDHALPQKDVKAIAISSMPCVSSEYSCSNADVSRLWLNTLWSTRSNFMSIPTDCPQRNERLGWMGDISVFSRTATFLTDAVSFLRRYLIAVRDLQTPEGKYPDVAPTGCGFGGLLWGSAGITMPWELYQQYSDLDMLREHYPSMKRYMEYITDKCIDKKSGIIVQNRQWGDLGDWLSLEDKLNDKSLIWECYYIYDLDIMQKMASVLGKTEDAELYAHRAAERRAFFNNTYVDAKTGKTLFSAFDEKRKGQEVNTQTSYVLPLVFGVVEGKMKDLMTDNLRQSILHNSQQYPSYSLLTGFIGTAWICKALSDCGMSDIAYRMLQQEDFPSWLYPVKNGATTIWERLNSYTEKDGFGSNNSMNSFNHYSFGAVVSWMYNHSLGIERDENSPGFKHFFLKPEPDPTGMMTHAEGYYDSMYGRIKSSWQRKDDTTIYRFTIPANSSATLLLPTTKGIKQKELVSGSYEFVVDNK